MEKIKPEKRIVESKRLGVKIGPLLSLQEMWVLPTHKYVGENAKYVGKGYPDVQNGVGKNVGRNASREAFPTPIWYGVGKGFPDARRCVGIDGVGKTLFFDFFSRRNERREIFLYRH
uniref:Uncharacterized protein n=1 Tax=Cucumis melo subsp. melo TaxID=412675 RepID=E5GB35_CUCME|nr:hypothetical protein [Cucumis melo subsp. melo]